MNYDKQPVMPKKLEVRTSVLDWGTTSDSIHFPFCRLQSFFCKLISVKLEFTLSKHIHFLRWKVIPKSETLFKTASNISLCSSQQPPSKNKSSRWFRHGEMSLNIFCMMSSNRSWEVLAPNTNRFTLQFPYGVLNVATALDSGSNTTWWYFCRSSNFVHIVQSWNLCMKSSTIGDCVILLRSMYWLDTKVHTRTNHVRLEVLFRSACLHS